MSYAISLDTIWKTKSVKSFFRLRRFVFIPLTYKSCIDNNAKYVHLDYDIQTK